MRWWAGALVALAAAGAHPLSGQRTVTIPAEDRALEADFEEVYRIGGRDVREEWQSLTTITALDFDAEGNLFVGDITPGTGLRVLVVGADGELSASFGRMGGGPGEFRSVATIVPMDDGRVAVPDIGRGVVHLFTREGELVRMVPMEVPGLWTA